MRSAPLNKFGSDDERKKGWMICPIQTRTFSQKHIIIQLLFLPCQYEANDVRKRYAVCLEHGAHHAAAGEAHLAESEETIIVAF